MDLSLVIPAYNEARRLPGSLRRIQAFFDPDPDALEVIVVVERSADGTLELARAAVAGDRRFRVIDNRVQRGKGYAVRCGMRRARGAHVFFMDADLSTPLDEIPAFLARFARQPETDVLIGSRADTRSLLLRRQHPVREAMGRFFNRLVQALAIRGLPDTQCGFKAFRQAASRAIFARQRLDGFAFDVEVLLLARGLGYRIEALPVTWINSPESRVRLFRDSTGMLWELLRVRRLVRRTLTRHPPSAGGGSPPE